MMTEILLNLVKNPSGSATVAVLVWLVVELRHLRKDVEGMKGFLPALIARLHKVEKRLGIEPEEKTDPGRPILRFPK